MQLTRDEDVDVAADIIVTSGIGAEHEGIPDGSLALEGLPQLRNDADGSRVKIAEGRIQALLRRRRGHRAHGLLRQHILIAGQLLTAANTGDGAAFATAQTQ